VATAHFESLAGKFAQESFYQRFASELQEQLKKLRGQYREENAKLIVALCEKVEAEGVVLYKKQMNQLTLPVDDAVLASTSASARATTLAEFDTKLHKFKTAPAFSASRNLLEGTLKKQYTLFDEINTKQL
jgi:predicted nucleic acid-binding protein